MMLFQFIALIMIVVVLAMIAPSLLGRARQTSTDRNQQNVHIARERLDELQAELDAGNITQEQYEQTRTELEKSLLSDVPASETDKPQTGSSSDRKTLIALLVIVPLMAGSLYYYLGEPAALDRTVALAKPGVTEGHPQAGDGASDENLPSVDEMMARLEQRLKEEPENAKGWYLLGRSYMSMKRYPDAVKALEKAYQLRTDQPSVLLAYADALAMTKGGRISGKPFEIVKQALALKPDDPTGLWLAGMGYEEQGDYQNAIKHWQRLIPLLAEEPQSQVEIRNRIARVEQKMAGGTGESSPASTPAVIANVASVRVKVRLDPALRDKALPTDTVFIFARAASGPRVPLAVVRKKVSDLPMEVTLDDNMAMMPAMKLSRFDDVIIGARVSKTGNATPQPGDLRGEVGPVKWKQNKIVEVMVNKHE